MQIDGFRLPPDLVADARLDPVAENDGVTVRAPALTPALLEAVCDRLIAAHAQLIRLPLARVITAIDAAARRLRDRDDPARRTTLRAVAAITGYSPSMVELILDRMSEDWLEPASRQLLTADLGGIDAVEGFITRTDRTRSRAVAPPLGLHVFSGNVPGVSVTSIVRALLVRSAVLGKTAAGEPVLAPAFARLLAEADPAVGDCVAVTYWQGGHEPLEDVALNRAGMVVHYGGLDAIASLRARAPAGTRFIDHGPRVSGAIVRPATAAESLSAARAAAGAIATFDQQGCVSPQFVVVLGDPGQARAFAANLAAALHDIQQELPRGRIDAGEAAAVRAFRTRAEFRAIAGEPVHLWAGDDLAYTVVCDPDGPISGGCLNRTVVVRPVETVTDLIARLAPLSPYLQTIGIEGFDASAAEDLAARLGDLGVTRVTAIADMPFPPRDMAPRRQRSPPRTRPLGRPRGPAVAPALNRRRRRHRLTPPPTP